MPFNSMFSRGRGTTLRREPISEDSTALERRDALRDQGRPSTNRGERYSAPPQGRPGTNREEQYSAPPQKSYWLGAQFSAPPSAGTTSSRTGVVPKTAPSQNSDWLGSPSGRPLGWGGSPASQTGVRARATFDDTPAPLNRSEKFKAAFEKQYMAMRARRPHENQQEWLERVTELDNMYKQFNSFESWQDQQRWLMSEWDEFRDRPGAAPGMDRSWRGPVSAADPAQGAKERNRPSIRRSEGMDPRLRALNERGR